MSQAAPCCFAEIQNAHRQIRPHVPVTDCRQSDRLSALLQAEAYLKYEHFHHTGSFKERGACYALLQLDPSQKEAGVIAASAGNHALALAYHGKAMNIPVTVVMPIHAPITKVSRCQMLGANVLQHGQNIAEAKAHAMTLVSQQGLTYINGFDDPPIIAGQGTISLELLEQLPKPPDTLIIPIGGGGLIAGMALAMKTQHPATRIIGVEPERAASYTHALTAGKPVVTPLQPTLADGLAVPCVGSNAFAIARELVDQVVQVNEQQIAQAVVYLLEWERQVIEGAGATAVAACLAGLIPDLAGQCVAMPLCGGNIDLTVLDRIIERGLAQDGRLCRFAAVISDRPGGLAAFAKLLAEVGVSVKDIRHERIFHQDDMATVSVDCLVQTLDQYHIHRLQDRLKQANINATFPE